MDSSLSNRVAATRSNFGRVTSQLDYEDQNLARLRERIALIEQDKKQLVKALGLLDRAIEVISANGIGKIESIVSAGLQIVFKDKSMGLVVEKKEGARGNSYQLRLRQMKKGGEIRGTPMDYFGGGPVNVTGFLLRLIMIKRFKLAKFLFIDESMNNVSKDGGFVRHTSSLLKTLCKDHGFTIFAITHEPALCSSADNIYRVLNNAEGLPFVTQLQSQELEAILGPGNLTAAEAQV